MPSLPKRVPRPVALSLREVTLRCPGGKAIALDRLIVLDDGRIVEQGMPEELIRRGGRFAALVELEEAGWDWRDGA